MAHASLCLILFTFLLPFCALAQTNGTLPVGGTITANATSRKWLSPSADFAFGFRKVQDMDLYLLCIWYNKIPDHTIVWFDNTIDPVPPGSTVELDAQIGLVLRDPQGGLIWNTQRIHSKVHHGLLEDSGNFALQSSDNLRLWESFQFPTDTILPSQPLVRGNVLISRQSETNFSRGRFRLQFQNNGNVVLTSQSVQTNSVVDGVYYISNTADPTNNGSESGVRLIFLETGRLYIAKKNNQSKELAPSSTAPASKNYFRATLNFDGVFVVYQHPKNFTGTPNWTAVLSVPDNICTAIAGDYGSGACGYNNVCQLVDGRPVCRCPEGYELINPNDQNGDCRSISAQRCDRIDQSSPEDLYDFVVVRHLDWRTSAYELLVPSTEDNCQESCLNDCFCTVAIFFNNTCRKKRLPLSNGRIDVDLNSKAFLKYNKSGLPTGDPEQEKQTGKGKPKERGTMIIVGSVVLGCSMFIFLGVAYCSFKLIKARRKVRFHLNNGVETSVPSFTYRELVKATNGFKEELGRGSFGIVYKGTMSIGSRSIIAVKKLDRVAEDGEREFRAEVTAIAQTQHKNLVRLLGFCDECQSRLLVYEYMSNGTLASFLFRNTKPSWSLRTQIACGIARGLAYLHEECSTQIIHCDIKPQNILLDDSYNARISDFGLAKLLALSQSRTHTDIRGTKGYVAPEWFRNSQINSKVDVYSFGVLLLEIITCRRNLEFREISGGGIFILVDWFSDCYREGRLNSLVRNDYEALRDKGMLKRFVMIGIWCIQEDSSLRPTMRRVSQMLEDDVEVPEPPFPSSSSSTT